MTEREEDIESALPDEEMVMGLPGMQAASMKVLAINRGLADPDDRDSPVFKRLVDPADQFGERIKLDRDGVVRKLMHTLARTRSLKPFHAGVLSPIADAHITKNSLSIPLEQVNPLDELNQFRRVSMMGDGGISSSDMITTSMQGISAAQFGFISPLEGPESEMAGVDVRMAHGVRVGDNGRIYQKFRNPKTGHMHWLSPEDLAGKVVGLPDT
jgi:DNA-directed RNA polymerase beta subunit